MVLGLEKNTKVSYTHIGGRHDQLTLETPYVYVLVCCVQMKRFRFHQKLCLLPQIINGIKQFHKYLHVNMWIIITMSDNLTSLSQQVYDNVLERETRFVPTLQEPIPARGWLHIDFPSETCRKIRNKVTSTG